MPSSLKYQDSIVYLHGAQALHYQGKYKEAQKLYEQYLQYDSANYVARAGYAACVRMADMKKQPGRYKVTLSKDFNYRNSSNFAPQFVDEDASVLMFTSNRQVTKSKKKQKRASNITGQQVFQLFQSRKNAAGQWEDIKQPEGLYSPESDQEQAAQSNDSTQQSGKTGGAAEMGVCCFTQDGKTMYFTYSKAMNGQDQGTKIMCSQRASGEWGDPQEVRLFQDSTISVAHPSLCPTGDTLYFVSDAPGGMGGKDIWFVEPGRQQLGRTAEHGTADQHDGRRDVSYGTPGWKSVFLVERSSRLRRTGYLPRRKGYGPSRLREMAAGEHGRTHQLAGRRLRHDL